MQQTLDKATVEALLQTNVNALRRALIVLHDRQTHDEQQAKTTRVSNGRGFGAQDAEFLSSLAEWVKRGRDLTPGQIKALRKKNVKGFSPLARYHRQLAEEAANKAQQRIAA